MLNVILIDDELFILKSIQHSVAWDMLGLNLVGSFTNGLDALEYIKNNPVDLLITDIRMPGISGLDLCDYVFHNLPHVQLILISGYADFAYAQKAINYNVLGYCIKPLDYNELTILLQKAIHKVNHTAQSNHDVLDALTTNNTPILKDYFNYHKLNPEAFFMMISVGSSKPLELTTKNHCVVKYGLNKYIYLSNSSFTCETFRSSELETLNIKGIGIRDQSCSLHSAKECLQETLALTYQYFFKVSPAISTTLETKSSEELIQTLNQVLITRNISKITHYITELANDNSVCTSLSTALKIWNMVITYITGYMQIELNDYSFYSSEELLAQFSTFTEMLTTLEKLLTQDLIATTLPASHNNTLIYILQYIRNHYTNAISLTDIASHFHLNPSYISQLFRKELSTTYTDYICQLRIDKAKELLTETDLSINAISEQVGYNDYFYFLKSFKKYVGITPGKYRN